jgi:hypothetical protein
VGWDVAGVLHHQVLNLWLDGVQLLQCVHKLKIGDVQMQMSLLTEFDTSRKIPIPEIRV